MKRPARDVLVAPIQVRGRGLIPGLAALALLACSDGGPGPAATPLAGGRHPTRTGTGDAITIVNHGPRERLNLYHAAGAGSAPLLFLGGRAATPLPDGGSAWADLDGARVVVFDRVGAVSGFLAGAPETGAPLTRPAFVAPQEHGLMAVEIDGRALVFSGGAPTGWWTSPVPAAVVGGTGDLRAATRTVFDVTLSPLAPTDPLLWIGRGRELRPVGQVTVPDQALLAPLTNAGWVAPDGDRAVYFAAALRPELQRYRPDGTLLWTSTWPREGVVEPRFGVSGSTLAPVFRVVQQALAVGPDGNVYVLATRGDDGPADRLLVFDRDGTWIREAEVDPWEALYVGREGHVYRATLATALATREGSARRRAFPTFDLPSLDGRSVVRLEDHRGRVVVVNFWASWCVPCRREMPLLSRFAAELDAADAVVLGVNEDVAPENGAAFLREIGGVSYSVAAGRGKLRDVYGYRGLPYTVVLDRQGGIVRTFYGFGSTIAPVVEAVRAELGREE